jgi:hypothetical protein
VYLWKSAEAAEPMLLSRAKFVNFWITIVSSCANLRYPDRSTASPHHMIVDNGLKSTETVTKLVDNLVQIFVRLALLADFVDGVQDGCMVLAPEFPADLRQRRQGQLFG